MIAKLAEKKPFNWKVVAAVVAVLIVVGLAVYFLIRKGKTSGPEALQVIHSPPQAPIPPREGPPSTGSLMDQTFCGGGPCIR